MPWNKQKVYVIRCVSQTVGQRAGVFNENIAGCSDTKEGAEQLLNEKIDPSGIYQYEILELSVWQKE
jgi:hypothetical protein